MSEKRPTIVGASYGDLASADRNPAPRLGEQRRRSERVLLRIPIEVRGTNPEGKPFTEKTTTLVINRHGARISLKTPVRPQDQITITNLQNAMSCPFRVVRERDQSLGEGPECGVECLSPEINFWGILFPEQAERPAK